MESLSASSAFSSSSSTQQMHALVKGELLADCKRLLEAEDAEGVTAIASDFAGLDIIEQRSHTLTRTEDRDELAESLLELADMYKKLKLRERAASSYERASSAYQLALEAHEAAGNQEQAMLVCHHLGRALLELERLEAATSVFERHRELAKKSGCLEQEREALI